MVMTANGAASRTSSKVAKDVAPLWVARARASAEISRPIARQPCPAARHRKVPVADPTSSSRAPSGGGPSSWSSRPNRNWSYLEERPESKSRCPELSSAPVKYDSL